MCQRQLSLRARHAPAHLGGEWIWLAYWRNPPDSPASLSDLKSKRDSLFSPEAFPNVDALQSKWIEIELEQSDFGKSGEQ